MTESGCMYNWYFFSNNKAANSDIKAIAKKRDMSVFYTSFLVEHISQ